MFQSSSLSFDGESLLMTDCDPVPILTYVSTYDTINIV